MPETLEVTPAAIQGHPRQHEYEEYVQRNPATDGMNPLPFEDWLAWRDSVEGPSPDEPALIETPIPALPASTETSTATTPGSIQYGNGNQNVNNNNVNVHVGGGESPAVPIPVRTGGEIPTAPVTAEVPGSNNEQIQQLVAMVEQLTRNQQQLMELVNRLLEQQAGNSATRPAEPVPTVTDPTEPVPTVTDPVEPPPTEPQPPAPQPEAGITNLEALTAARDEYLKVVIRRKARMSDSLTGAGREDASSSQELYNQYKAAMEIMLGSTRAELEAQGKTPEQIMAVLARDVYLEQRKLVDREVELNEQMLDESMNNGHFKFAKKFLRKWSKFSTKKKLLIGLGVGVGVGLVSSTAGLGLFGLAAGSAAKFSLGIINRKASLMNAPERSAEGSKRLVDENYARFRDRIAGILGTNPEQLPSFLEENIDRLGDGVDDSIRRAQRRNKIGNGVMLVSGVVLGAGLTGAELGIPGVDLHMPDTHVGAWIEHQLGFGSHHAAAVAGGGDTVPGSEAPWANGGGLDLSSLHINPNTIHAGNMDEFQTGVIKLLSQQGIQTHGASANALHHMNQYMMNRPMASGMGGVADNLHQNLINGHEVFTNPSQEQGFAIGADGTGREELLRWMAEAQRNGMTFSRT